MMTQFLNRHTPHRRQEARAAGGFSRSVAAFTLIEAAIGSCILVIAIIGTLTMASQSFIVMQNCREYSRANQILQQKMEDLRLLNLASIQALPNTFTDPNDTSGKYSGTIAQATYRTDPSSVVQSVKVTLSVTWTGRGGKSRTLKLSSVFTSFGLDDYVN